MTYEESLVEIDKLWREYGSKTEAIKAEKQAAIDKFDAKLEQITDEYNDGVHEIHERVCTDRGDHEWYMSPDGMYCRQCGVRETRDNQHAI